MGKLGKVAMGVPKKTEHCQIRREEEQEAEPEGTDEPEPSLCSGVSAVK